MSELISALSHALDVTEGQPVGHCVRCCWIGMHLGREIGLQEQQLWELYYTLLLKDLGCSSNAARICELYLTDDLSFKRDFKQVGDSLPQVVRFVLQHTGTMNRGSPSLLVTVVPDSGTGALAAGQSLTTSVRAGFSMAQIGEFSFIIATLGMTLNVTSSFLYPIVVAVSAVTTFTTPFMIKMSTPFSEYLSKKLPRRWIKKIERYSANAQAIKSVSNWQIVINSYLTQLIVLSVIIFAVILLSSKYILPLTNDFKFGNALGALITLIAVSPFLWADRKSVV